MGDPHRDATVAQPVGEFLGDRDRTVPSSGAADRDGQVAAPFLRVLREQ